MKTAYILLINLLEESRNITGIDLPLLIMTLAILVIALMISIHIAKKNKLYIKPDKQEEPGRTYKENEVAS